MDRQVSTDNNPAISILMPVYNAERYVAKAVESILNQTFTDFEFIIINDGSTDDSLRILERYARHNNQHIRLFNRSNKGLIATLNEGLALAQAPLIARMDADDLCHPLRIEKQKEFLSSHPECVAVGTNVLLIDPEGLPICPFVDKFNHETIDAAHMAGKGGAIAHPTVIIRREALDRIGCYRNEFPHAEDIDLFLRLAEVGQLANLPEILFYYRQHMSSIGYQFRQFQCISTRNAVLEAWKRREIYNSRLFINDKNMHIGNISPADVHKKWAFWALSAGNRQTARKHAWIAFRLAPFFSGNIKLLACALRGY